MNRPALVPCVALVVVAVAVWQTPGTIRSAFVVARDGAHSSRTDREVLPAHVVGIEDTSVFPKLAALMPPRSTYSIELSRDAPAAEAAGGEVQAFLVYYLLPRRAVPFAVPHMFTIFIGSVDAAPGAKVVDVGAGVHLVENR
jgi:hypothetical protein